MGGRAFADQGLHTPRMPETVYRAVLEQVESKFREHFTHVAHPVEAPGKSTYGDIDVLVAEPIDPTPKGDSLHSRFLAEIIGGERYVTAPGSSTTNIAIRWPKDLTGDIPPADVKSASGIVVCSQTTWIQVDVQICPTVDVMNWMLFLHAHGDLCSMLGGIIRRFGLINTQKGFFLRIEEAEKHNKEQSRVKMTTDPSQVLEYMGLDVERYGQKFSTLDEMMSYAATCRFHDPGRWKEKNREALKANDRQRANKRPAFAYWTDTFLPEHSDGAPGTAAHLTRDDVIEDAKRFFGNELAARFDERKETLVRQIAILNLWATIRKSITAEGAKVTYAMKGLKAAITSTDGYDFNLADDPDPEFQAQIQKVRSAYAAERYDEVEEWGLTNWEEIATRQERLDKAKSHQHFLKERQREAIIAEESGGSEGSTEHQSEEPPQLINSTGVQG